MGRRLAGRRSQGKSKRLCYPRLPLALVLYGQRVKLGVGLERSSAFGVRPIMTLVRVTRIPHQLPEGIVLVINHAPGNGFQAWIAELDDSLIECACEWNSVDLHGLKHYRVRRPKSARLMRVK